MNPRTLAFAIALVLGMPFAALGQSAAQLLQQAAEFDRLANEAHQNGVRYANSKDKIDADFQFAAERNYRLGAAQLRQRAGSLGGHASAGFVPSSSSGAGSTQLAQAQNALNMGIGLLQMQQDRQARERAAADQAQADREVAEAERANAAAQKELDDQLTLAKARSQFSGFYTKEEVDHTLAAWDKMEGIIKPDPAGAPSAANSKAAQDVADIIAAPVESARRQADSSAGASSNLLLGVPTRGSAGGTAPAPRSGAGAPGAKASLPILSSSATTTLVDDILSPDPSLIPGPLPDGLRPADDPETGKAKIKQVILKAIDDVVGPLPEKGKGKAPASTPRG
jgi:hypothetical protein